MQVGEGSCKKCITFCDPGAKNDSEVNEVEAGYGMEIVGLEVLKSHLLPISQDQLSNVNQISI